MARRICHADGFLNGGGDTPAPTTNTVFYRRVEQSNEYYLVDSDGYILYKPIDDSESEAIAYRTDGTCSVESMRSTQLDELVQIFGGSREVNFNSVGSDVSFTVDDVTYSFGLNTPISPAIDIFE